MLGIRPIRAWNFYRMGTFIVTTYGHWVEGEEPFVVTVRFTMDELDLKVQGKTGNL